MESAIQEVLWGPVILEGLVPLLGLELQLDQLSPRVPAGLVVLFLRLIPSCLFLLA